MEEPIQRVKAYPLFQSKRSKLCKGKATNGQDFLSTLQRSAKLLQNVAMGKEVELDNGGESSLDDASDDGDEIRNFEVSLLNSARGFFSYCNKYANLRQNDHGGL